jgi:hypothetical protein
MDSTVAGREEYDGPRLDGVLEREFVRYFCGFSTGGLLRRSEYQNSR